jgi:diguanylate cyclase
MQRFMRYFLLWTGVCVFLASPAYAQSSFAQGTLLQWPSVLTGAFLGFLLLPVPYNIVFFYILREPFLIWQNIRVLVLISLTISLSSLPLGSYLAADGVPRQMIINILFDTAIALVGPFMSSLLEPGVIDARLRRMASWLPLGIAFVTPAKLMTSPPALYVEVRGYVLLGVLALVCIVLVQAIMRGSSAARYLACAWSMILAVCGISLYHDIVLGRPFTLFLYFLFAGLAFEMLLTSIGIGDRFMRIKLQRDEADARAVNLERLAYTDPLTGLANRRALEARFAQNPPHSLAMIDIDHFKQINDRFGHDQGDRVIIAMAHGLSADDVFAARIGGEEFALLVYAKRPLELIEHLRLQASHRVAEEVAGFPYPVTASAGVATITEGMSFVEALKAADERLYDAKTHGRSRTIGPDGRTISLRVA